MNNLKRIGHVGDKETIDVHLLVNSQECATHVTRSVISAFRGNEVLKKFLDGTNKFDEKDLTKVLYGRNIDQSSELFEMIQEFKSKFLLSISFPDGEDCFLDLSLESKNIDKASLFEKAIRELVGTIENNLLRPIIIEKYSLNPTSRKLFAESISKLTGTDVGVEFHMELLSQASRLDPKVMTRGKTPWNQLAHEFKDYGGMPKNLGYLRKIMCDKKRPSTATVLRRIDAYLKILAIEIA